MTSLLAVLSNRVMSFGMFPVKETQVVNNYRTLSQYRVLLNDLTAVV